MIENYNHYYKFFTTGLAQLEQERQKILDLQDLIVEVQPTFHFLARWLFPWLVHQEEAVFSTPMSSSGFSCFCIL